MEQTLEFWVHWAQPAPDAPAWNAALLEGRRRVLGTGDWFRARHARVNRRTKIARAVAESAARDASSGAGKTCVLGASTRDGREVEVTPTQLTVVAYDPPERWPEALRDLRGAVRIWLAARSDLVFGTLVPRDEPYALPEPPRDGTWAPRTAFVDWVGSRAFRGGEHWERGPHAVRAESAPFEKCAIGDTVELVWTRDLASNDTTHADVVARYLWWSRRFAWPPNPDYPDERHRPFHAVPGERPGAIQWEGGEATPAPPSLAGDALAAWVSELAARPRTSPHDERYVLVDDDKRARSGSSTTASSCGRPRAKPPSGGRRRRASSRLRRPSWPRPRSPRG